MRQSTDRKLCRQVGLSELGYLVKSRHIQNGQIRQDLSVQLHTGLLEPLYQLIIGKPAQLRSRIHAGYPKAAELPPPNPPVPVSKDERSLYRLPSGPIQSTPAPHISLCQFQYLFFSSA